ncbi:OB-fold nucleic acid binding domain-containing protein [Clostridium tagluense]|uniref:OB-fold nucleic acid binding domain-containing protein n=1 Tax=Clostridium tagluense TaxID=360422 RepID=UPI002163258A|nr:OB-fold nucleic acid binding domain-containing protein [Clostridium tagluense]
MFRDYVNIENLKTIMSDANEFVVERVKKLNELMQQGVNPYPYSFKNMTHSKIIIDNFENISEDQSFVVAGRIMLMRKMGKVVFLTLRDQEGDIQAYFNKTVLGEEKLPKV